jgi:hypothetical protein
MANIITVSAQLLNHTPPSRGHNIGVASILDVIDYTGTDYPFIRSIVYTSNPVLTALYCNAPASDIKVLANAALT